MGCAVMFPAQSFAQSGDLGNRISRIENELQTLSRAVYRGETPSPAVSAGAGAAAGKASAAHEIRLQQIESELQQLRGSIEEQNHAIRTMQTQLEKALSDADVRFQMLEKAQKAAPSQAAPAPLASADVKEDTPAAAETLPAPLRGAAPSGDVMMEYESAFALLKASNYEAAGQKFEAFVKAYPDHKLSGNAQYWLGETYYVQGEYDKAARTFAEGYQKFPKGSKAPDNLLKLGMSLAGLNKPKEACVALGQLQKDYPSESAPVLRRAEQEMKRLGCE